MKLAGFFLTVAGFFLTLSALVLMHTLALRSVFVGCGLAVECVGLAMITRGHQITVRENSR